MRAEGIPGTLIYPAAVKLGELGRSLQPYQRAGIRILLIVSISLIGLFIWRAIMDKRARPGLPLRGLTVIYGAAGLFTASFIFIIMTDMKRGWREDAEARLLNKGIDSAYIYIPDVKAAKVLCAGNDNTLSDLYWIRLLAYDSLNSRGGDKGILTERFVKTIHSLDPRWGAIVVLGGDLIADAPPRGADPAEPWRHGMRFVENAMNDIPNDYRLPLWVAKRYFQPLPYATPEMFDIHNTLARKYFLIALRVSEKYDAHPELCPTDIDIWRKRRAMMINMVATTTIADSSVSVWKKLLTHIPRRTMAAFELVQESNNEKRRRQEALNYMRWETDFRTLILQHVLDEINDINQKNPRLTAFWNTADDAVRWDAIRSQYNVRYKSYQAKINAELSRSKYVDNAVRVTLPYWRKGMVPVDTARIPLRLKNARDPETGTVKTTVYSVRNNAIRAVAKQQSINWLIRHSFFRFYKRYPADFEELSAYYRNEYLASRRATMTTVFMLKPGDNLKDDLLGGEFKLTFPGRSAPQNASISTASKKEKESGGGEASEKDDAPVAESDSAFLDDGTEYLGRDRYVLKSFNDPDKVNAFLADLLNSRIPPLFLPPDDVRRAENGIRTPKPASDTKK